MRSKKQTFQSGLISACAICGSLVMGSSSVYADDNWYLNPGIQYIFADSDRQADDGPGYFIGVGKQVDARWNIEASLMLDSLDFKNGGGDFDQKGIMVDGLYFFERSRNFSPYAVMGAGILRTDAGNGASDNIAANLGLGFFKQLSNTNLALRGDVRYRLDTDHNSVAGQSGFGDVLVSLSLQIPLGKTASTTRTSAVATSAAAAATPVEPQKTVATSTAMQDRDHDGVADANDRCPDTAAGTKVDTTGCEVIALPGVTFETGSARLSRTSTVILDGVAKILIKRGNIKVEVAGHTDSAGSAVFNRKLSAARANSVRDYLIGSGVNADLLSANGYGPDVPVADNSTAAGRSANRRVELRILQ